MLDQTPAKRLALVLDDTKETAEDLGKQLQIRGFDVIIESEEDSATTALRKRIPADVVVFDFFYHHLAGGKDIAQALLDNDYGKISRYLFTTFNTRVPALEKYGTLAQQHEAELARKYMSAIVSTGAIVRDKILNTTLEKSIRQLADEIDAAVPSAVPKRTKEQGGLVQ